MPAGEFLMGSTDEDIARVVREDPKWLAEEFADEKPQRKVYLDGYWMYKTEVTVAQYRKFCEATKREMPEAPSWGWKDSHPVVRVTWADAAAYAEWVGVTLPSDAQWEKAARGTDGLIYPWGNDWDAAKCANSVATKLKSTVPVGSYAAGASPHGCLDMAGNVWVWVQDWYGPYSAEPQVNATGPSSGEFRILRGGSWASSWGFVHTTFRTMNEPTTSGLNFGFRCVSPQAP